MLLTAFLSKSAVVFPGQYTVDVIHQFEKVISKSKSMSVLRAAEEVYGRKVASTSWYSHYNVWRLGKDNPEIQKMISTSVAAGRTEAGLWEAVCRTSKAYMPVEKTSQ